jgi:methyl-accepting chemotaxis protein
MDDKLMLKRKAINLGIKTKLQLKYLKLIVATIVIIMIITTLTVYATFHLTLSTAQLGRYAEARLSEIFSWLNWLLVGECIVFALIAGFMSLKLTHRIAGPLFRVEKMVRDIAEKGVAEPIRIRQDDDLQELVDQINNMITRLSKR